MAKILVIEDENDIRENIVDMLLLSDYEVVEGRDGLEGVERARLEQPDLILCDIMMPRMNGYEVVLTLSADPKTVNIPIIFLTAKVTHDDVRRGMAMGADDYLTKPFTAVELQQAIVARLKRFDKVVLQGQRDLKALQEYINLTLPHELRTPLSIISGYLDILRQDLEEFDPAQTKRMLHQMNVATKRMTLLIENYVAYSQARLIRKDPELIATLHTNCRTSDAHLLIEEQAAHEAVTANRFDDLLLELSEGALFFLFEHLKKVLSCVLNNAFKYSAVGTAVEVSSRVEGGYYLIVIKNDGRGMTAEQIAQIGENRQFNRKVYEQQGVGLGLAIAQILVELYHGDLIIESEVDAFTAVTIKAQLADQTET